MRESKIVLIVSEKNDSSTDYVVKLLGSLNANIKVFRINCDFDFITNVEISSNQNKIYFNNRFVSLEDVDFVWYRKGIIKFNIDKFLFNDKIINISLNNEINMLLDYITIKIFQIGHFNNYFSCINSNKLHNLEIAKLVGFNIPNWTVRQSKLGIKDFFFKNSGQIINKPIFEVLRGLFGKRHYNSGGTVEVSINSINKLDFLTFPMFLQEKIHSVVEIRVFFILDYFYSVALISENQRDVDVRNRIYKNEVDIFPIELPRKIKKLINDYCKRFNLDSCSIDLLLDSKGNFIFIESNPTGQFFWISELYNYEIENKIADLILNGKVNRS